MPQFSVELLIPRRPVPAWTRFPHSLDAPFAHRSANLSVPLVTVYIHTKMHGSGCVPLGYITYLQRPTSTPVLKSSCLLEVTHPQPDLGWLHVVLQWCGRVLPGGQSPMAACGCRPQGPGRLSSP